MIRFPVSLLLLFLLSFQTYATPLNYKVDSGHTTITLSWLAFGGLHSQAVLGGVTGNIRLDPNQALNDKIQVEVPVSTLSAGNAPLTWQLKGGLFFDVSHFPTLSFIGDRVVAQGKDKYQIFGVLVVKNHRQPVILQATLDADKSTPSLADGLIFNATTSLFRSAYDMGGFSGIVDDRIAVNIHLRATTS